jgi:hypothetical protein
MTKMQNNKEAGQKQPGTVAFRDPRASTTELHQMNGPRNTKPFAALAMTAKLQRVSIADSFGASPRPRPWMYPPGATPAGTTLT